MIRKKIKKIIATASLFFVLFSANANEVVNSILGAIVDSIFELLFEVTALPTTFKSYPYCDEEKNFISYDSSYDSTKIFVSTQMVTNTAFGIGNVSRLDGYFWRFFGPLVENTVFTDYSGIATGNPGQLAGQCLVGGQITMIKTNPFTMQFALQYGFDYGLSKVVGKNSGNVVKMSLVGKSYPGINLEVENRFSFIIGDNFFTENELHVGYQLNRVQIFGTWSFAYDYDYSLPLYNQWGVGAKLYL